jgi:hypothetical protein
MIIRLLVFAPPGLEVKYNSRYLNDGRNMRRAGSRKVKLEFFAKTSSAALLFQNGFAAISLANRAVYPSW